MPIVGNRFYNNPEVGAAFSNLAGLFAPPSAQDAAGWAEANARNEQRKRLSWLFDNPTDATASERAALIGVQNYGATPDRFATTNSTLQRGQDIESGDRRYSTDVGASTLRANNAATVAGSLQNQRTQSLAGLFGPLNPGQVRPELPAEIATQFGAPGAIGSAVGAQSR